MFARAPSEESLKGLGLSLADYPVEEHQVWPETWPAVHLLDMFRTQWRAGPGGVIGLDYAVIQHELTRLGVSRATFDQLMADIRVLEDAAIAEIYKAD